MAEKTWAAWYDSVLPALPGLPTGAPADFIIRRAAIEFFDRSLAWRVAVPAFDATATVGTYTLAAPVVKTMVAKLLELRFQGKELEEKSPAWLKEHYGTGQDWRSASGDPPTYFTSEYPNQVTIVPKPITTTAGALAGWCAVKPLDDATGVDEAVWREYHDPIAALAKAMGLDVPKKPYSNPQEAMRLRAYVDGEIGMAAYHRERGGGSAPFRTRTHWI